MDSAEIERDAITRLVRELGAGGATRVASPEEVARLREFFGRRVLRSYVDPYVLAKFHKHVEDDLHWPEDTAAEEYLESLRETVLDSASSIYLTDDTESGEWALYFVGRVRRAWRGPRGSNRVVVIFNGERHRLVTGFQPVTDDAYVERQNGFWIRQR